MQKLIGQHEIPGLIILWRKIQHSLANSLFPIERVKSYLKPIEMYRIFPTIDLFTVTGRMNFFNPCLQNIPKDFDIETEKHNSESLITNEGFTEEESAFFLNKINDENEATSKKNTISLRGFFIPMEGRILLSADYCQLELRIITNLCQDQTLISIFNETKYDVFNLLASKWLNLPIEQIDEEKRQNVKKVYLEI